jgi:hypothetical protein
VLEPVKLQDDTLLKKLTSDGQVLQFAEVFLDQVDGVLADGKPQAYFVDSKKGVTDDNVTTILQLLPAPSLAEIANGVVVPVIKEAGLFSTAQLTAGTASLPVPHRYVESIFLPLARFNATTCFMFYKQDSKEKYQTDYDRALQLLGQADPRQRPKPADSDTRALQTGKEKQ